MEGIPLFTAHNIRLDDGTRTRPEHGKMEDDSWLLSAQRLIDLACGPNRSAIRIADLGCLEGGYSVEFARSGFQVLGLEARASNIAVCEYVRARVDLPNLSFVRDDVWNLPAYGAFDVIFCCGLLYHLDRPRAFIEMLAKTGPRVVVLQTHVSPSGGRLRTILPRPMRRLLSRFGAGPISRYGLSRETIHEGMVGRWYVEDGAHDDAARWASWGNRRSFWPRAEELMQALLDAGHDIVVEGFDSLAPDIVEGVRGYRRDESRGLFVGIKSHH